MIVVSEQTKDRIERLFPKSMVEQVQQLLLTRCGDDLASNNDGAERIHFAVLKLSGGNFVELEKYINMAHQDWRDVLMAAGFGENVTAHKDWLP